MKIKKEILLRTGLSLSVKFVMGLSAVLIIIMGLGMAFVLLNERSVQLSALERKGQSIASFVSKMSMDPIFYKDILKLDAIVADACKDKEVVYAFVYDPSGKMMNSVMGGLDAEDEELKDLIKSASAFSAAEETNIKKIKEYSGFLHISLPILEGQNKMGTVFMGLTKREVSHEILKSVRYIIIITLLLILALNISIFLMFKYIIVTPLKKIRQSTDSLASGDLTVEVSVSRDDEISSLGAAINKMATNLKEMLAKVRAITDSVSSVTQNIALSSGKVLSGANVQNESIEKTAGFIEEIDNSISSVAMGAESLSVSSEEASSAMIQMATSIERVAESANTFSISASDAASSIEEMVASIKEIAESLELISASSEETASSITEINTAVKEVERSAIESVGLAEQVTSEASDKGMNAANAAIKGMEDIKESVGALSEVINRLGKRSEEIGQILNVIAEVADQTSLLALNAAILAAQAGEHGKGFAVVADEIKSLAGKTSLSTKEIANLVESVQSETRASVEMAEKGIGSVEKGAKLVSEVNIALKSILGSSHLSTEKAKLIQRAATEETHVIKGITEAIRSTSEQIEFISKATKEQSKGSRLIIESIEKIKELSQHVKKATNEQSTGSKQISETIGNVSLQAEQIAGATSRQQERSKEIVKAIENIKRIAGESVSITSEMNSSIKSMEEEAKTLLSELQRFKV